MKQRKFYVLESLRFVYEAVKKDVCERVFIEERPSVSQEPLDSFVVISLPVGLDDMGVWQDGVVRFELFVRNKSNNQPNLSSLQGMLDKLTSLMPLRDGRFFVYDPRLVVKGADNSGFSIWNCQCRLRVTTFERLAHP